MVNIKRTKEQTMTTHNWTENKRLSIEHHMAFIPLVDPDTSDIES
jgi:hypothetical protein